MRIERGQSANVVQLVPKVSNFDERRCQGICSKLRSRFDGSKSSSPQNSQNLAFKLSGRVWSKITNLRENFRPKMDDDEII